MRKSQYNALRLKLESERDAAKASLADIQRQLEALDIVWNELLNFSEEKVEDTDATVPDGALVPSDLLGTSDMVDSVVADLEGRFGVNQVIAALVTRYGEAARSKMNKSTVSGRLRTLCNEGLLEIAIKGSGRTQSIYQQKPVERVRIPRERLRLNDKPLEEPTTEAAAQ